MRIDLTVREVLLSYEEPMVVLAEDAHGSQFLGVSYDRVGLRASNDSGQDFLFVQVPARDVSRFRRGFVGLRTAMLDNERGTVLIGHTFGGPGDACACLRVAAIPMEALPLHGLVLTEEAGAEAA